MPIIGSYPITLSNGTLEDANQVMVDFNYVAAQVNANAAQLVGGNNFSGAQTIAGDTIVTLNATQTLSNKTLSAATINGLSNLTIRQDSGDGPQLIIENRVINGASVHKYGSLIFSPFRDVADPVFGAAIWAEGVSGADYYADLVLGGSHTLPASTFPTESLRLLNDGNIALMSPYPGTGLTPVSKYLFFECRNANSSIGSGAGIQVAYNRLSDVDYGSTLNFLTSNDNTPVLRMSIDNNGNITGRGIALTAVKANSTTRNNTATFAADPDLGLALPVGYWAIRAWINMPVGVGGNSAGAQYRFAFSGTATDFGGTFESNQNGFSSVSNGIQNLFTGSNITATSTGTFGWLRIEGALNVTAPGNLSLQWAQAVATASNLTFAAGSFLTATKLF